MNKWNPTALYKKKLGVQVGIAPSRNARGKRVYEAVACFIGNSKIGKRVTPLCGAEQAGRSARSAVAKAVKSLSARVAHHRKPGVRRKYKFKGSRR